MAWREDAHFHNATVHGAFVAEGNFTLDGGAVTADLEVETIQLGDDAEAVATGGNADFEGDSFVLPALPTEDPEVAGQLWNNEAVVNVSA